MSDERPLRDLPGLPPVFRAELVGAALPVVVFAYVTVSGSLSTLTTFHVGVGTLWTALVVCYGFGVAPLLDGRDTAGRVALLERAVPVTVTLFPILAFVTIGAGLQIALAHGLLAAGGTLVLTILGVTVVIAVLAFGVVFPTDLRVYRGLRTDSPDLERLARLGTRNAKVVTLQGTLQLSMLFLMSRVSGVVV
jgi:hypothetical protein